jgi:tetratricopeptide (TPR) repeat protein
MKNRTAFLFLLALTVNWAVPGWPAGTAAQSPGVPATPGQIAAADQDLITLLPSSTIVVLVLDMKRLLEIDVIAKALEAPEFMEGYDEFVKMSGVDLKRDITYVGWGLPASAIASRMATPPSPAAMKELAFVVGLRSDKARLLSLIKEDLPEAKEEAYNGVSLFIIDDGSQRTTATPGVLAEAEKIRLQFAVLDDTHIVFGGDLGVRNVIDVYQKKADSLAAVPEMTAFLSRVDKSGVAWSAVSYPPEVLKMIADSNPLLRAIEGFKGMIMAIDDKDSTLVVDLRTLGGTPEQNATFASNLNGIKSVGALYAAEQPAVAELLNGIAITSGEDFTRVNLTVSHETLGKLMLLMEPKEGDLNPDPTGGELDWEALFKEAEDLGREGRYDRAVAVGERALRVAESKLGPDHPDLARILDKIADLYCQDNLPQDAEPLWVRSLAIREKALGPDHPDLAESLNKLAMYYEDMGQDAKAVTLYDRLLTIQEASLGPEHLQLATLLDKMAHLSYYQQKYTEAEPLWRRSLAIREKSLGPNHPDVATNLHALALLLQVQGKYAAAEPLWKRALKIREKSLGPDHPDVATTLGLLAELYRATDREKDAEELEARAARILSIKR